MYFERLLPHNFRDTYNFQSHFYLLQSQNTRLHDTLRNEFYKPKFIYITA